MLIMRDALIIYVLTDDDIFMQLQAMLYHLLSFSSLYSQFFYSFQKDFEKVQSKPVKTGDVGLPIPTQANANTQRFVVRDI